METLQILGWIYLGIILGSTGSVIGLSLFQVRNVADLKAEIRDLRLQRQLLKEEVDLINGVYGDFNQTDYLSGIVAPVFFGSALTISKIQVNYC